MQPAQVPPVVTEWTISSAADVATLVGLAITVIGFVVTIITAWKSKSAAERAEKAAKEARSNLLRVDSISGISSTIAGLQDIKRLHRSGSWDGMPERYGVQRRMLIEVRTGNSKLTDQQRSTLQSAIQQLSLMEQQIEEHLARPDNPVDTARLNRIISRQADALTRLLTELKIGEEE
jgi:hypothetical protein